MVTFFSKHENISMKEMDEILSVNVNRSAKND